MKKKRSENTPQPHAPAVAPASDRNPFLDALASVQLALILLTLLGGTSIIGTIIPQNADPARYAAQYGPAWARFIALLDLGDMYNSWWFLGLLALFCANLTLCSLDRVPRVFRLLRRDRLRVGPDYLAGFDLRRELTGPRSPADLAPALAAFLRESGWRPRERVREDGGLLLFAEKTPWARLGVYVTHLAILIVLAGALLGSGAFARRILRHPDFAYRGVLTLAEGEAADRALSLRGGGPIPLGFSLRCDRFDIDFHDNGMPKSYRSRVTVLEQGKELLTRDIEVNKPLRHRGVTFYQANYEPFSRYAVRIVKQPEGAAVRMVIPQAREAVWREGGLSFGIINREQRGDITRRVKLWLSDGQGEPAASWLEMDRETAIDQPGGRYLVTLKQVFATGLQVTRDPGVGLVYGGCCLLLIGLYIAFFLSHRELYLLALPGPDGAGSRLLFAGRAHKNPAQFTPTFERLADRLAAAPFLQSHQEAA